MTSLQKSDPAIFSMLQNETQRQTEKIELIASENIVSPSVQEIVGSVLTNKYAEGFPGKRYYGGCEHVDVAENLARDRAKELFGAEYANVQPHSGSQANMGVYLTVLQPGDTILGMDLAQGGHLTHGSPANFSGKLFKIVSYGVDPQTETVNYDKLAQLAKDSRPKVIVAGFSAYSRFLDFAKFRAIADEVGAFLMTDMAHVAGLVAAGLYPNPVLHSHFTTTTTHKTLRGPRGGMILIGKDGENTIGAVAPKSGRLKSWGELIDSTVFPGIQGGPLMHVIAGKAVAFGEALQPGFKVYAQQILKNAQALCKALQDGGIRIVSGGTDNHLMLLDLTPIGVTGKDAEVWLDEANITVNKNAIPFDQKSPMVTSGIRVGTPAVTTRGMKEADMKTIADFIIEALKSKGDEKTLEAIQKRVTKFCKGFPLFGGI